MKPHSNRDRVSLIELQQFWDKLIEKIANSVKDEIIFDDIDLYWTIGSSERYSMEKKPELQVGSLMDDLDELKKLIEDKDRPTAAVNINRFAAILDAISQKLNPL